MYIMWCCTPKRDFNKLINYHCKILVYFLPIFSVELQAIAGFNSWVEQGQDEINKLVRTFSRLKRLFLLGDLNVGPGAAGGVVPVQQGIWRKYKPQHDKTSQMTLVASEDSDQSGQPLSLIRVFAVRALSGWLRAQCFFIRTANTLIRLGGCPGWSE